jgi:DnaJ-class molecular chaperone
MAATEPIQPQQQDHYFSLGVASTASAVEIKSAYKRLALIHHPDKKAPGANIDAAEFLQVSLALNFLQNHHVHVFFIECES